ncbi:MAG: tetratricopeptide repeat protein [Prevotella sp.]|nr:tetratricopeptide repeat protein [Prevotella sp.]
MTRGTWLTTNGNRWRLFGLAFLFLSSSIAGAQTNKEWRDSLQHLNKLIEQQPQSVDLRLRKAAVNIELSQWEYAVEEYGRVLQIDTSNIAAHFFRAYVNNRLRRYDMARADYINVLRSVPRHFNARLSLALTLQTMGKFNEAIDQLNILIDIHPDSAVAYAARADIERRQQQYEVALYDIDKALCLKPANIEFLLAKHYILTLLKRDEEAYALSRKLKDMGVEVEK